MNIFANDNSYKYTKLKKSRTTIRRKKSCCSNDGEEVKKDLTTFTARGEQ